MPKEFHARFSAKGKLYLYRIAIQEVLLPPLRRFFHWERRPLDLSSMREAASFFVGRRDFAALATNPGIPRIRSTVRTIKGLHLVQTRFGLDLYVSGDGFLYNQVRTLAGTLVEVGRGKFPPSHVPEILKSRDRKEAGPTLPPQGLFLVRVHYGDQYPPSRSLRRNHNCL
jgi:tRNA pseudouridine38-40 synthase